MNRCHPIVLLSVSAFSALVSACDSEQTCQPVAPPSVNAPPNIQALRDTTIALGDTLWGSIAATDPDGGALTYQMTTLLRDVSEVGYVVDAYLDSNTGEFWFAPGTRDRPSRSILFTAIDEGGYPASTQIEVETIYYVDQENDYQGGGAQNLSYYAPMGQEFVPSLSALDIVEVWLNGYAGKFVVRIRPETIIGAVLAVSDTLVVPGGFKGVAAFEFERVSVIPQQLYVMEIVQVSGGEWLIGNTGRSTYPLGRQILSGQPRENNDLWFREGAKAPRPPEVVTEPELNLRSPRVGIR
jgi:hypothetical protein